MEADAVVTLEGLPTGLPTVDGERETESTDTYTNSSISRSPSLESSEDRPLLSDDERNYESYEDVDEVVNNGFSGSSWAAYVSVTCVVAGTGVLGLPYSIKQGGWISLSLIPLSMLITLHTSVILIKCLYYNKNKLYDSDSDSDNSRINHRKRCLNSYGDIGYQAFGNFGRYFMVGIFNSTILLGVPVLFFILAGQSLDSLVDQIWNIQLGVRVWTSISAAIVALPFIFTKTLKEANWNKVVAAAMATCAIMYALVAASGYYVYGNDTMSPIFLNLPKGLILTTASLFITIHVLMTAPILLTSFACDAESYLKITNEYHSPCIEFALRALFRTGLIISCAAVAVLVPFFGDFMSLLGALSMCVIVFIFPVVFYLKLFGWRNFSIWELLWNAFVILVGVFGCVVGTKDAVVALVRDFREMGVNN
ncbi:5564_t:CDS:2 [Scutellospora calospora]|uniref:5564_t:CDS:1 n=1 Tax=Scutellospora calospora TaxID=85575 RepID=A0ACA9JY62_9GLOM|nr:5564_t:CDS:2 [Scutellospora calospora]